MPYYYLHNMPINFTPISPHPLIPFTQAPNAIPHEIITTDNTIIPITISAIYIHISTFPNILFGYFTLTYIISANAAIRLPHEISPSPTVIISPIFDISCICVVDRSSKITTAAHPITPSSIGTPSANIREIVEIIFAFLLSSGDIYLCGLDALRKAEKCINIEFYIFPYGFC